MGGVWGCSFYCFYIKININFILIHPHLLPHHPFLVSARAAPETRCRRGGGKWVEEGIGGRRRSGGWW